MALQETVTLTLATNVAGSTVNIIDDSLVMSAVPFNADTQQVVSVANGANNQVVSLGGLVTVTTILMISDQPLTVKLNAEATGHLCQNLLMTGAAITGLTVSNASGFNASPRFYMLG